MPKDKELTRLIPRMYKWNLENIGLFFFIRAQVTLIPTITMDQAIKNFRREIGISIDEWDDESIRSTYSRLQKEFYEGAKKDIGACQSKAGFYR